MRLRRVISLSEVWAHSLNALGEFKKLKLSGIDGAKAEDFPSLSRITEFIAAINYAELKMDSLASSTHVRFVEDISALYSDNPLGAIVIHLMNGDLTLTSHQQKSSLVLEMMKPDQSPDFSMEFYISGNQQVLWDQIKPNLKDPNIVTKAVITTILNKRIQVLKQLLTQVRQPAERIRAVLSQNQISNEQVDLLYADFRVIDKAVGRIRKATESL